ncbi:MAG: hypothetical protein IKG56_01265 [Clostridia bacterium]|nr:hypothetical protein [Clostridia bacterium]
MSVVTFTNNNMNETGQTLATCVIACSLAFEHNFRILLMSTDFNNNTMENCFFNNFKKQRTANIFQSLGGRPSSDISNGIEGLIRMFASNRASREVVKSFARPVLTDRLDILPAPKTKDIKEYENLAVYFSQIADIAKEDYDIVLVDLSKKVPKESREKMMSISSAVVVGLTQQMSSIQKFMDMKAESDFYNKNNILLCIDKYNQNSKYTDRNVGRFLNEKVTPLTVPYNILFSDSCSEGQIIDYVLGVRQLTFIEGKDGAFYEAVKKTAEKIDYKRKEIEYGQV